MKLVRNRMLAAAMIAGLPFGLAAADVPEALDRVPADMPLIISMGNVSTFFDQAERLTSIFQQEEALANVQTARMMLKTDGINAQGSAAIVFTSLEDLEESKQPPVVVLLPVSDYAAVCSSLGGTGEGVEELMIEGESVFVKDLGDGYALAAPTIESLEAFNAGAGNSDQHQSTMGRVGEQMSEENAVLIIANMEELREPMLEGWEEGKENMRSSMAMGGAPADQIDAQVEMMDRFINAFADNAQRGMMGMTGGEFGFSIEMGVNFKPESEFASTFTTSAGASDLMGQLPGGDYLFAYAMNYSNEGLKNAFKKMAEFGEENNEIPGMSPMAFIDNSEGMSMVMGVSPGGLMGGGLFTSTTAVVQTSDPDALIQSFGESMEAANDTVSGAMSMTTSFAQAGEGTPGENAHRWSIQLLPDMSQPSAMQMQMMMPMLFGPTGGPGGYIAKADDDSVVITYSTKTSMLENSISAVTDGGELAQNQLIKNQAERLHDDAFMLAYVDMGSMFEMVLPTLAMFMGPVPLEVPEEVTPMAMSMSAGEGGVRLRTVVPEDIIQLMRDAGNAFGGMGGGMGGPGGEEEPPSF